MKPAAAISQMTTTAQNKKGSQNQNRSRIVILLDAVFKPFFLNKMLRIKLIEKIHGNKTSTSANQQKNSPNNSGNHHFFQN